MTQTRSSARRHRGARTIRSYTEDPRADRLTTPATNPRDAIRYWRDTLHISPLFVYFIQDERGPVKIGRAYDPLGRMSELQCGNPFKLTLRAVVLVVCEDEEARIHDMWRTGHMRGEWFGAGIEADIIARARRAQKEQIDAKERGEHLGEIWEIPVAVLSQTGMRRG